MHNLADVLNGGLDEMVDALRMASRRISSMPDSRGARALIDEGAGRLGGRRGRSPGARQSASAELGQRATAEAFRERNTPWDR